jgi:hypothetical protein
MCENVLTRIELTEKMTEKNSEYIQKLSEIVEQYMEAQNEYINEVVIKVNNQSLAIESLLNENAKTVDYVNRLNEHIKFLAEQVLLLKVNVNE